MNDNELEPADTARTNLLELAWGIIANAGGGDWNKESIEWQDAAARWRDSYFGSLPKVSKVSSEQPNTSRAHEQLPPATVGEWTKRKVYELMMSQEDDWLAYEAVVDAHNAALTAVYAKGREHNDVCIAQPLRAALAAEREKHRPAQIAGIKVRWPDETAELRAQLAAAQAAIAKVLKADEETWGTGREHLLTHELCESLRKLDTSCLDAAIAEATKPLVEALEKALEELEYPSEYEGEVQDGYSADPKVIALIRQVTAKHKESK